MAAGLCSPRSPRARRRWGVRLGMTGVLVASAGLLGCETIQPATCDPSAENNQTITYDGGQTVGCVYSSSVAPDGGWAGDGELLNFYGGVHYQLLTHAPGCTPLWVQAYLSFDRTGTADGGVLAQASGNQVEVLGFDDQSIQVTNDSCVDYWVLVTAGLAASPECACGN